MKAVGNAAAIVALAFLTFFQFPGHTYLQQDSQIYVPIMEHLRDPTVLRNDIVAQYPHVAFTLYDEAARVLRWATGLDFHAVLTIQQVATRAFGIWGLYLLGSAMGVPGLLVAAIVSLGATIVGPSVLTFEYEPTPRAFALPLLICAMGLASQRRDLGAGVAAGVAFLYHPPTVVPVWIALVGVAAVRRKPRMLLPLGIAILVMAAAAWSQASPGESHALFSRLTPLDEKLQRWRAPYLWISSWPAAQVWHWLLVAGILAAAFVRVRARLSLELRIFLLGLPLWGLATLPLSWLFLEHWKWNLMPLAQPLRTLLFVALSMQILTTVAGAWAAQQKRFPEAAAWFALAYLLPLDSTITLPVAGYRVAVLVALAGLTAWVACRDLRLAPVAALVAFFAIPMIGEVTNYPELRTAPVAQLSGWARNSTPKDAVFLFPSAGPSLYPGIFRAEALRAVYVDWKGGGQMNYLRGFGELWWFRWQQTMTGFKVEDMPKYEALGISYVVLHAHERLAVPTVFENATYAVYRIR